jgi:hypothetical protein
MREIDLTADPVGDGRAHSEKVLLLVTSGNGDDWGELEPLKGTSWAEGVEVVSSEVLSHALHGFLQPLLEELGRDPRDSARRVLKVEGECAMAGNCIDWNKDVCRPGGTRKQPGPPECYDPPLQGASPDAMNLFRTVAQAWRESRHTIVVMGDQFSFR